MLKYFVNMFKNLEDYDEEIEDILITLTLSSN